MSDNTLVTRSCGNIYADLNLPDPQFEPIIDRCIDDALRVYRQVFCISDGAPNQREPGALRATLRVFLAKASKPQWSIPEVGPETKREPPPRSIDGRSHFCTKCKVWMPLTSYCKGMYCPLNPS